MYSCFVVNIVCCGYTCCKNTKYPVAAMVFSVALERQLILLVAHEFLCFREIDLQFAYYFYFCFFTQLSRYEHNCNYTNDNDNTRGFYIYNFLYKKQF